MNSHTTEPHAPGEFGEPQTRPAGPGVWHAVRKVLRPIASLRVTVALFVLGMLLIFFGTVAQLDNGIWTVVGKYFWSWVVFVPFDLFHKFLGVFWQEKFPSGATWEGSFPFPGGILIGLLMVINLVAAHFILFGDLIATSVKQTAREGALRKIVILVLKRSGIYLIHGGLLILFAGEYITREYAIEQQMVIDEGESINYTSDTRHVELAVIDHSAPDCDHLVTIPENMLRQRGRISHPDLPFDVEITEYMVNSTLDDVKPGDANPADHGAGLTAKATKRDEVSGVDPSQKMNYTSVYAKFLKKGTDEAIGSYLFSLRLNPEKVKVDGKTYEVSLRFKRYYKPYRIYLDKFRFDRFTGTQKAKNYSSDVRVYDEAGNLVIPHQHIAMNEPLRYNGETFYQSSFDDRTEKTTILQVVNNPGWRLPYIACIVVSLGLIVHFLTNLVRFLLRSAPARTAPEVAPVIEAPNSFVARALPWIMVGLAAFYLLSISMRMTPKNEPFAYDAAARMRVVDGGRVKPLDTVARVSLRLISGREEYEDESGRKIPAIQWYLDTLATGTPEHRGAAWKYRVIRVDNEQLLNELKLPKREGFRYSMDELSAKMDLIRDHMVELQKKVDAGQKLNKDESKFKELVNRIQVYLDVVLLGGNPDRKYEGLLLIPPAGDKDWQSLRKFHDEAMKDSEGEGLIKLRQIIAPKLTDFKPEYEERVLPVLGMDLTKLTPEDREGMRKRVIELLSLDPTTLNQQVRRVWSRTALAMLSIAEENELNNSIRESIKKRLASNPAARIWEKMLTAYREGRPNDFAQEVEEYNQLVNAAGVPDVNTGKNSFEKALFSPFNALGHNKVEITFNRFAPFYQCAGLYVWAFVLALAGFTQVAAGRPQWALGFRRSAFYILLLTFAVHSVALFARMYLMERPMVFVTNLYSSAIFIGLGCVGLCLIIERIFPMGVGNVLAAMLGLTTTIIAHNIASEDTLEMMQAVLDTNFWLATHVTTVTLGYTATFVAGFLGALYVLQMLGAVVRDSFQRPGEPTVGDLLAFSVAVLGMVGIPVIFLWFMASAIAKYELLPSEIVWGLFYLSAAVGVAYAMGLMLVRVGWSGMDSQGKPVPGRVPNLAQPVAALALTPERGKIFGQMVYGVVCFATLLSFVGTVLGGIWADQSWGRFWGWDPKENGAVLIVLWNSLILHARWAGLVKDRGVAVLAIFGNAITAWSWFGTNQLQIGLHAYGFDSRLADGCFNFWVSQLLILALGLIPQRFWTNAVRRAVPAAPAATTVPNAASPPNSQNVNAPATNSPSGQTDGHSQRDRKKQADKRK